MVYPTGKIELNITLERDENVLYKDGAAAEDRYIVTKMRLWVLGTQFTIVMISAIHHLLFLLICCLSF